MQSHAIDPTAPVAFGRTNLRVTRMGIAAAYAPSFEIAVAADYDRFGELRWRRDATVPSVDASQAVVYVHPAYSRYRDGNGGDRILLQMVYTIWFAERPPSGGADLLSGALDGVVWRATLAPDGEPVLGTGWSER